MRYVLGIETSCDDTSVAIIDDSHRILANVVSSQNQDHQPYGGVVPELASRIHIRKMVPVYRQALAEAELTLNDMSAIAVTAGPGLIGSLLVGVNFAKALAYGKGLPLLSVNHIRGHVRALFLEHNAIPLPALALIVSGGHTHLFRLEANEDIVLLTKTRDDSAGEAFDKLAKMLGLGFPGGPVIDRLAQSGRPDAYSFSFPRFSDGSKDYSFSGLKSAAARAIEKDPQSFADKDGQPVKDLAASFQAAVVHQLINRVGHGLNRELDTASLLLGGGVACNSGLRQAMQNLGEKHRLPVFLTSPSLSTDNAAMIAAEGLRLMNHQSFADFELTPYINYKGYDHVNLL